MSFEIVEKSQVKRELMITVTGESVSRVEGRMIEQVRKTMTVKGFRKGKVPASIVRERAGASVTEDARRECLQEEARKALSTIDGLLQVGEADIVTPKTEDGGFVAKIEAEVAPKVEIKDYKGLTVKVADAVVTDEEVDKALEARRERHAVVKPVEGRTTVEEGDVVTCELSAPNDAAMKLCHAGQRTITVGRGDLNADMEKCLIGASVDEPVQMTAKIGDSEPVVTAVVKEIKQRVLPALDDNFALDTGDAETLEGLRDVTRKRLMDEAEQARNFAIEARLTQQLRELMPVEIPEMYVRARAAQAIRLQLEQMMRQQIDDAMLNRIMQNVRESEVAEYRTDYHNEVILNAIAAAEKIEVTPEETLEEATKWFGNAPKGQIEKWLKTGNASQFVADQVKRDRALAIVKESAKIEPMTAEEIEAEKKALETKENEPKG